VSLEIPPTEVDEVSEGTVNETVSDVSFPYRPVLLARPLVLEDGKSPVGIGPTIEEVLEAPVDRFADDVLFPFSMELDEEGGAVPGAAELPDGFGVVELDELSNGAVE
jgi:hypothetical protein